MADKPRIGVLTERMTMGFGVDLVIHEQAVRLVSRGYPVTIFPAWKTEMYDNQPYRIEPLTREGDDPVQYFSPEFMHRSFEIMNQQPIDVWMIHTPPFYYWLTYLPAPVIMVEHGSPPGRYFKYRQGRALDAQTRKRQHRTFRATRPGDGIVAISEFIRSGLPPDVARSTTVIHNGADHYPIASRDAVRDWRVQLGIRPRDVVILWVGRIQPVKDPQPYKGLGELLRLAPKVRKRCRNAVIVAAGRGDGSAADLLRRAGVIPVFNVPSEAMGGLYAAADLFVNTSVWEGFNLPLVEAQYQGTPVVALNVCAHPEVVMSGYSGMLADSIDDVTESVVRIVEDERLRQILSEGARKQMQTFRWDTNVDQIEKLIEGCLRSVQTGQSPERAELKKTPRYFIEYAQYLIQQFGWRTFFRECKGWFQRRL
ncbi:glycosyltransferase family 4 protein [bacterium]|nr:glycosyltransferase family 4 protein [candidate division CSSED10-310 bacterium]